MMTNTESQGAGEWRIIEPSERAKSRGAQAFIHKQDGLMLGLPGLVILEDPLADDIGPEGVVEYLNNLEAAARELSSLREQVEGYREMMLHTWAESIKAIADGVVIKQAEYSPQRIHEMTIEAIQKVASLRETVEKLEDKSAFLATVMGFLTSLRDDSDEESYFTQRAHELCLEYAAQLALTSPEEVNQHEPSG